jgi:hypothetical protein
MEQLGSSYTAHQQRLNTEANHDIIPQKKCRDLAQKWR